MITELVDLVKSLAQTHAFLCYTFVFLISYLESFAFVGLIMPGAGFAFSVGLMAYHNILNIFFCILSGAIGAILADLSSFFLAKYLRDKRAFFKIKQKYSEQIEKGEDFFDKYGAVTVFIGRFIGIFRPVIPFIAGLLDMNPLLFILFSSLSGILWGISYFGSGYLFGMGITYVDFTDPKIIALFILILILIYLLSKRIKKTKI